MNPSKTHLQMIKKIIIETIMRILSEMEKILSHIFHQIYLDS